MYLRDISKIKVLEVEPKPLFVIKSLVASPFRYQDWKIFINVTHNAQVPKPKTPFHPLKTFNEIMNNDWEIPILTSPMRKDVDKKSNPCLVFDCCISSDLVDSITNSPQLREILIEWCLESVELREDIVILREDNIKLPKLNYKGTLPPHPIKFDKTDENVDDDEANGTAANTFTAWKNELLQRQEMEEQKNELTTLFPQRSENKVNSNLIQDITDKCKINHNDKANKINLGDKNKLQTKKNIEYNVTMRKTNDTSHYKLKIDIFICDKDTKLSQSIKFLNLQINYSRSENTLLIENKNIDHFNIEKLNLALPNIEFSPENIKIFNVNDSRLALFI